MTRQKIVAGNWKMNKSLQEAKTLVEMILNQVNEFDEVTKIIIPPFPYLEPISGQLSKKENFFLGAQNCHTNPSGAFTGEVSAGMLSTVGCKYVLVGHSERRQYFKEKESDLKPLFISIYNKDANTRVRAAAIKALSDNYKGDDLNALYEKALTEQSYAVVAEGFDAIAKVNPELAMKKAVALENEPSKEIIYSIADLYAKNGTDEY